MYIVHWEDFISGRKKIKQKTALTIGVFDGVHIGHQRLLKAITGGQNKVSSCVVTFTSNPALILKTKHFPGTILTTGQKLTKLELFGIQTVILIDFSYDFSRITGEEFWLSLLSNLCIYKMVVGRNFHFGHKRKSGIETLLNLSPGVFYNVVDPVLYNGEIVSSTRIRTSIKEGKFSDVKAMLGSMYQLDMRDMELIRIQGNGGEIDLKKSVQVIPAIGNYSAHLVTDKGDFPCDLVIKDKMIRWAISGKKYSNGKISQGDKNIDYTEIKYITFIKRS